MQEILNYKKSMLAIESYKIFPIDCWVTECRNRIISDKNVKSQADHDYYKILRRDTRYRITRPTGSLYLPHLIYETPTKNECYFASGIIKQTRNYIHDLDKTYFRFYDDAEEVKNNIISFIKWLQTVPKIRLKNVRTKEIMNIYGSLLADVPTTQEWEKALSLTFKEERRSDLSPLAMDLQEESDLIPASR